MTTGTVRRDRLIQVRDVHAPDTQFSYDRDLQNSFRYNNNVYYSHHSRTSREIAEPYGLLKYSVTPASPTGPAPDYDMFLDTDEQPIRFMVDKQTNPHALIAGKSRKSGKTTFGEVWLSHEIDRNAFAIIFDPKGEYFQSTDIEKRRRIFHYGFDNPDNPISVKPSLLTMDDWKIIIKLFVSEKKDTAQKVLRKVTREIKRENKKMDVENIKRVLKAHQGDRFSLSSGNWWSVKEVIEELFFELEELELFDEENGFDLSAAMKCCDGVVFDMKSPEENEHISILIHNVLEQLFRMKVAADPRHGKGDRSIWDRRVWVVFDEAGDPENGPVNTQSKLECRNIVERIFGKFAYANIMGMIITQHMQHISTKVITNCQNIFVGRLDEPNAVQKVSRMSPQPAGFLEVLFKNFDKGDFYDPIHNVVLKVNLPPDWTEVTS